jgi:hypothetical protein
MNPDFRVPPLSKDVLTSPDLIVERLQSLIGTPFALKANAARTNGSRMRKLIAKTLESYSLPPLASRDSYTVMDRKGLPSILREYIDTYVVTTGRIYNLQVWNKNPSSSSVQIEYSSGEHLSANDVRIICVRVEPERHYIRSVLVLSPEYITANFGPFGKDTIKYQLIIASKARLDILYKNPPILFYPDTPEFAPKVANTYKTPLRSIRDKPVAGEVFSLEVLRDKLVPKLIGTRLDMGTTKNRGQALEQLVALHLGYIITPVALLLGSYPDILNQVLEVKVQDSPTVDLGMSTPEYEETIPSCLGASTRDVRYLIALTDRQTSLITGLILCPGAKLGDHFTYAGAKSYKSQRSIPMRFFDEHDGQALFNPGHEVP